MSGDLWEPGANLPPPASTLPSLGGILSEFSDDARDHFKDYLTSCLGLGAVQVPLVLLAVVAIYGGMGIGAYYAIAVQDDEELIFPLGMGGMLVGLLLLSTVSGLVLPPLTASVYRAVWAFQVDGVPLTATSAFSTFRQDLGKVYAATAVLALVIGGGVLACYIPGLLLAFALHFAWARVVIGGRGIGVAMRESWDHVVAEPGWNLGIFGLGLIGTWILGYIPLLGMPLGTVLGAAWNLRAYRAAFADDDS